jgi:phosphoserine phosphatase
MTRNKLEKMAKAAKIFDLYGQQAKQRTTFLLSEKEIKRFQDFLEALEKFAGLVAAHEREECAKVCEAEYRDYEWAIHERDGAESCAAAIRARGQG